ncbi:uncharacterized protein LOC105431628 [Pogonomyrmex barbatus]|uniref:Uncharacterized protein LOC105431628 n=1 Tax=Pogonomyrmex barbatus TaxID=144034 RepID=A0A6I9WLT4_9HYME|nr:uncharacterized protein LOC105431628 [Pogonomyrmex barbatus]
MQPVAGLTLLKFVPIKRKKMKRIALFVLALIALVTADDIQDIADKMETKVEVVQTCLDEAELKIEDITSSLKKFKDLKAEELTEEDKQAAANYMTFLACMLQKTGMMDENSKFKVDELVEQIVKDGELKPIDKKVLTECITSMNEDNEMTKEDRVFGMTICVISSQKEDRR